MCLSLLFIMTLHWYNAKWEERQYIWWTCWMEKKQQQQLFDIKHMIGLAVRVSIRTILRANSDNVD